MADIHFQVKMHLILFPKFSLFQKFIFKNVEIDKISQDKNVGPSGWMKAVLQIRIRTFLQDQDPEP